MNPSFLLLRRPLDEALRRYGEWIGAPELEPAREVSADEALELALDGDEWRGLAVYVFASGPWTVFEELSGGLGDRAAEDWLRLADGGELVYAGYNDAIPYGEFLRVERGRLVRHFVDDEQEPSANVNVGRAPEEGDEPWLRWPDVARWVDEQDELLTGRERGRLWIHAVSRDARDA